MLWDKVIYAAAVLAIWYWVTFAAATEGKGSWTGSAVKTGASGLLALGFALGGAPWTLVIGLAFGAMGDFALSRPSQRWFLAGMAAFAAGHIFYLAWMSGQILRLGGPFFAAGTVIAIAAFATLAASTEKWLIPFTGQLRAPVRAYVAVIALMGVAAILLPENGWERHVQLGAALFILSDLLLAILLFRTKDPAWSRSLGLLVWPLYFAGQAALALFGTIYMDFPKG